MFYFRAAETTGRPLEQPSMSRAGCPYDNAMAESFMKTLKTVTVTRHLTPKRGAGPRGLGASCRPVRASMSASQASPPTGRPTLSALRRGA